MLLEGEITCKKIDNNYTIHFNDNYFTVTPDTYQLLLLLLKHEKLEAAYAEHKTNNNCFVEFERFEQMTNEIIEKLSLSRPSWSSRYLHLKFEFLSSKTTNLIGLLFRKLFQQEIMIILLVLCAIINILNIYLISFSQVSITTELRAVGFQGALGYLFIILLIPLFHEIGHISACKRFSISCGGIGSGFYIFFPVFYSDVTNIWMLPRRERLVVNIAGIYFELIISSALIIAALIRQNEFMQLIPAMILIGSFFQFNPFLRYDGYWIVSDFFRVPNLREQSRKSLSMILVTLIRRNKYPIAKKTYFLGLYAVLSYLIIFGIITFFLISQRKAIVNFPIFLTQTAISVFDKQPVDVGGYTIFSIIVVVAFYILSFKIIIYLIKRWCLRRDEISECQKPRS